MTPLRQYQAFCANQERRIRETLARFGSHVRPIDRRETYQRETYAPSLLCKRSSNPIPKKPVCP